MFIHSGVFSLFRFFCVLICHMNKWFIWLFVRLFFVAPHSFDKTLISILVSQITFLPTSVNIKTIFFLPQTAHYSFWFQFYVENKMKLTTTTKNGNHDIKLTWEMAFDMLYTNRLPMTISCVCVCICGNGIT